MWVDHIKCELIEAVPDPDRFNKLLQAILLFASLELIPHEIEEELFTFLDQLSRR